MKVAAKLSGALAVAAVLVLVGGVAAVCFLEQINPLLRQLRHQDRNLEYWREALVAIRAHPGELNRNLRWPEDFLEQHGQDETARRLASEARDLFRQAQPAAALGRLEELQRYCQQRVASAHDQLAVVHRRATYIVMVLFFEAGLLVLLFLFLVRRWLTEPLESVQTIAANLAEGKLEAVSAAGVSDDEFGAIQAALLRVGTSLRTGQDRREQLEQLAKLGEACAHVTSNVRNTIGSIRTLAQYEGTAENMDPNAKLAFQYIVTTVNKMEGWIRDLHATVSPAALNTVRQQVEPILHDALSLVQPLIQSKEVQIQLEPADAVPEVNIDRGLVEQALVAVLSNAIEASPQGGRIRIRTEATPGGALIEVADEGNGMNSETRQRAFQAFYTTKPNGTGLGLAVAHAAVKRHGGEIQLESEPNRGTRVVITFPAEPRR